MRYTDALKKHLEWNLLKYIWPNTWLVQEEIIWYVCFDKKDEWIIIPKGFITDCDSIPLLFKPFFPLSVASLFHDVVFQNKKIEISKECYDEYYWNDACELYNYNDKRYYREFSFFEANKMYRDMLIVEWVSKIDAYLRWIVLNLFSYFTWIRK